MVRAACKILVLTGLGAVLLAWYWGESFDPARVSGAKVLLTGASAGIGEQMAYHYAQLGAHIVLTARREAVLQRVAETCRTLGPGKIHYIAADMALPDHPERVVQFALQKLGGLDYLVLNHIGDYPYRLWDGNVERLHWLLKVNFLSYVQLATTALPTLTKSKGSVIVVSSVLGRIPTPFSTSYTACKFALEGFFGSLRHELALRKADVSITICILGLVDTESAMEKIRGVVYHPDVAYHPASPAPEAALAIVKGGALRAYDTFYPPQLQLLTLIRDWFPRQRDWLILQQFNHSAP
ncbi:hydroxysteroid 11-beta-dehydrogenase 1-like protein [Tachyglossus aculeatus]|uniref:hydroxysteroid 11-beta-dehydrogenase 1-like protein n=1 Tax=Tachyglossus aculeatus TaxID=9261 RepID=UPI0018F64F1E|nr:hydroxysteroid 11-beta-dehydrogenase 1-like protein [Tachyglossus aculeatus]XP_038627565.1 hydroxysteroid 11-beta-dehydrogenase 1-like protein [Tachyglossus aculeatus]